MAETEIKLCKIKLTILMESMQTIRKYANECVKSGEISIDKLNVRMKRAEELLSQFLETEIKLCGLNSNEALKLSEIEKLYYAAMSDFNEITSKAQQLENNDGSGFQSFNSTSAHNLGMVGGMRNTMEVRLPKLEIPKFSGNYVDWQPFYEIFKQQIHEFTRLSDVQKFRYLKGYLIDEAADLIKHMSITSANYSEALDKLCKRYDRKRYIINSFVRKFIEQSAIQQANSNNIRKIHDVCDEVIRGLKSVGPEAEGRDPWLVFLVLSKLDNDTKSDWAEYSANEEFPRFEKLLEFLSSRVDTLESYGTTIKFTQLKSVRNVRSLATNAMQNCELCNIESHRLYECKKFNETSVSERRKFITDNQRCYNCLNAGHTVYNCRFRGRCQKCYRKHHSLLHDEEILSELNNQTNEDSSKFENISTLHCTKFSNVSILPTVLVSVQNSKGIYMSFKALLDSASEVSFISERTFKLLELSKDTSAISIKGLGSTFVGRTKGIVKIKITNDDLTYQTNINAHIVPHIASVQPRSLVNVETIQNFKDLKMADPNWINGGEVDILLGSDIFFDILSDGKIQIEQIILYNTKFGWMPVGKLNGNSTLLSTVSLNVMMEVDSALRRFWEVETIPNPTEVPEDDTCEQLFLKTTKLGSDNKFVVRLPFKISPEQLGSTYNIAFKRLLSMEKRFQRDSTFKSRYQDFMTEYENLGHMKLIGNPNPRDYYLPHHGVLKQSTTTRLRVVFDGSTKSTTNLSLNDALEIGPTIQATLVEILLRFRQHKYVLSGDIEKMYRMIWIHDEDAKHQQVLWRKEPNAPLQAYQLLTVTYGTTPASFLATRCIKEVANRIASKYPQIADILSNDVYVDDLMCGSNTIIELIYKKDILVSTLKQFGFNLRKLRSNNREIITEPENIDEITNQKEFSNEKDISKILGLIWDSRGQLLIQM